MKSSVFKMYFTENLMQLKIAPRRVAGKQEVIVL